jgi:NMD protein affecting ribosome stability and mRNA decay
MPKRRDQLLREKSHDPTKPTMKPPNPAVCPDCGATYIDGRWTWRPGPAEAPRQLCSACKRTRDNYPAGFVTIRGRFAFAHRDEIVRIARNTEAHEKEAHPINRIMSSSEDEEQLLFQTTEVHLAQAIGKAIRAAFKGELKLAYEEDIVRVDWHRDQ